MIPIYHISQWDLTRASFIATGANAIHFPVMPPMMLLNVHNSALTGKRDQQSSNIIVFCIAEINPSNSSKWNTKPPLSQQSMGLSTNLPLRDFRVSREARTLGLAAVSHRGPSGTLAPELPILKMPKRRETLHRAFEMGPPKGRPREMLRLGTNRFSTAILLPGAGAPTVSLLRSCSPELRPQPAPQTQLPCPARP